MNNFNVKVTESNGDIHIYTKASRIEANGDLITVINKDMKTEHWGGMVDEVVIKPNT